MRTFVAAPTYNGWRCNGQTLFNLGRNQAVDFHEYQGSVTTLNMNRLWCAALNTRDAGITHFLMIHADVQPLNPKWFSIMHEEMEQESCDVLSVVIPMKTGAGLTSTAVEGDSPWLPHKLSMTEIERRPATFSETGLLVNTGLVLIDLRKPWVDDVIFHMHDGKEQDRLGRWVPVCISEDWDFSRQARNLNATIYATRKVKVAHRGEHDFLS